MPGQVRVGLPVERVLLVVLALQQLVQDAHVLVVGRGVGVVHAAHHLVQLDVLDRAAEQQAVAVVDEARLLPLQPVIPLVLKAQRFSPHRQRSPPARTVVDGPPSSHGSLPTVRSTSVNSCQHSQASARTGGARLPTHPRPHVVDAALLLLAQRAHGRVARTAPEGRLAARGQHLAVLVDVPPAETPVEHVDAPEALRRPAHSQVACGSQLRTYVVGECRFQLIPGFRSRWINLELKLIRSVGSWKPNALTRSYVSLRFHSSFLSRCANRCVG